jgi:hypothetical protein
MPHAAAPHHFISADVEEGADDDAQKDPTDSVAGVVCGNADGDTYRSGERKEHQVDHGNQAERKRLSRQRKTVLANSPRLLGLVKRSGQSDRLSGFVNDERCGDNETLRVVATLVHTHRS